MAGIFPEGGVSALETLPGNLPTDGTDDPNACRVRYHRASCLPRFDPVSANAVIGELLNIVRASPYLYDCAETDNIALAIQYLIQQGIPQGLAAQGSILPGGSTLYTGSMTPDALEYNDYMQVVIIPSETNVGPTVVNIDSLGDRQILRNDGMQLRNGDLVEGIPQVVIYYGGYFWMGGIARSQVPIILEGTVDFWIRPDGSDTEGDGSENTAQKAFRTINGAWAAVGARYTASPSGTIRLRLGTAGTYEGAVLRGYGGQVEILGDPSAATTYVIAGDFAIELYDMGALKINGVTLAQTYTGARPDKLFLHAVNSSVDISDVVFNVTAPPTPPILISITSGSVLTWQNAMIFQGAGIQQVRNIWRVTNGGIVNGTVLFNHTSTINVSNLDITEAGTLVTTLSSFAYGSSVVNVSAVSGKKYDVALNSVANFNNLTIPGDVAGTATQGGQVVGE